MHPYPGPHRFPAACLGALLALAAYGAAQVKGEGGDGGTAAGASGETGTRLEWRKNGWYEVREGSGGAPSERRLDGKEIARLRRAGEIQVPANKTCKAEVYPVPKRLTPGGSGVLKVLVTLAGEAVGLADSCAELLLEESAGFRFGAPVLMPAGIGRRPGRFQGKPVRDDYVMFEVPVTVDPGLPIPHHVHVAGLVTLDLNHGVDGKDMGRFYADVAGLVKIGHPLPNAARPARVGASGAGGTAGPSPAAAVAPADRGSAATPGERTAEGTAAGTAEGTAQRGGHPEPRSDSVTGGPVPGQTTLRIGAGIGALGGVLLLILLLWRRPRHADA